MRRLWWALACISCAGSDVRRLSQLRQSLAELEATAKELFESGHLLQQLATLDSALRHVEQRLKREGSNEGQELYFMARILRGTIHQQSLALDDQAVQEQNAYTLSNPNFWDEYYSSVAAEPFDWYGTWDSKITWEDSGDTAPLGSVIRPFLPTDAAILMVGCGRSDMSEQMYREGFQRITNIDISRQLLDRLQKKLGKEMPMMSWRWMNVSNMAPLNDGSFDAVLEKGTLDSLQDNPQLFKAALWEMHRVLRKEGVLISITDTERLEHFEGLGPPFSCQGFVGHVAKQKRLRVYACHKRQVSILDDLRSWLKFEL